MQIVCAASMSVIAPRPGGQPRPVHGRAGLPLTHQEGDDYWHSEAIEGAKHFGVWPLQQAAQACFGVDDWPAAHPVPQASTELEAAGHAMLHGARVEPWGQTVARLLSPEGLVVGLSYAPWMH